MPAPIMDSRLFTLDDANRVLPLVRAITADAVRCYREVKRAITELERIKRRAIALSPGPRREAVARQDAVVAGHLEHLRALVDELEGLGCHLRDYDCGVVDFPAASVDSGGFFFYCWTLGEGEIAHWHAEDEGHEERRMLGARA